MAPAPVEGLWGHEAQVQRNLAEHDGGKSSSIDLEGSMMELPLQAGAHLSFHLVDLTGRKHALTNNTPQLVGIHVVENGLQGEHECGHK